MVYGIALALAAGACLGGITSFASLAYDQGVTVPELMAARVFLGVLVVAAICRVLGQPLHSEKVDLGLFFGIAIGGCLALVGFGYMGSVHYITPGMAAALLFVYPMLVLAVESLMQRKWPDRITVLAYGLALAGICLCVGAGLDGLDWRGVVLALAAACGMAGQLVLTAISSRKGYGTKVLLPAQSATLLAVVGYLVVSGDSQASAQLPQAGLWFMSVVAVLYCLGIVFSFIAIRFAPAKQVALMMNVEPLSTLLLAWILVGERMASVQYAGIVLAVVGISLRGMYGRGHTFATRTGATRLGIDEN